MKKKVYKILATALAMAIVMTAPTTAITTHAQGFNADSPENTTERGERPANYGAVTKSPNDVTVCVTGGQKFRYEC